MRRTGARAPAPATARRRPGQRPNRFLSLESLPRPVLAPRGGTGTEGALLRHRLGLGRPLVTAASVTRTMCVLQMVRTLCGWTVWALTKAAQCAPCWYDG